MSEPKEINKNVSCFTGRQSRAIKTGQNPVLAIPSHESTIKGLIVGDVRLNLKGSEYTELDNKSPGLSPLLYNQSEELSNCRELLTRQKSERDISCDEEIETYDPPFQAVAVNDFTSSVTSLSFKKNDKVLVMFKSNEFFYTEIDDIGIRIAIYDNVPEGSGEIEFKIDDVILGELEIDQEWLKGYSNAGDSIGLLYKNSTGWCLGTSQ
ncbi:hypothetical protein MXB_5157, partial [Myxobolus squamalis]